MSKNINLMIIKYIFFLTKRIRDTELTLFLLCINLKRIRTERNQIESVILILQKNLIIILITIQLIFSFKANFEMINI